MNSTCPVCNQVGLPDYKVQHIICPQCNSDLKPYLLLKELSSKNGINNLLFIPLVSIFVTCISVLLFFLYQNSKSYKLSSIENEKLVTHLKDSILVFRASSFGEKIEEINLKGDKEIIVIYKVKKGDYTWKIAEFFYADGYKFEKIEKDNNLIQPYTLKVGQTLDIKINQN